MAAEVDDDENHDAHIHIQSMISSMVRMISAVRGSLVVRAVHLAWQPAGF